MPFTMDQVANPLPGDGTGKFHGATTECHSATLIWLYHATYGVLPPDLDAIYNKLIAFGPIMRRIASRGVQLKAQYRLGVPLVQGSVLVFMKDGEAMHSCTVKTPRLIAGYNQMGWFREDGARAKGRRSSYSEHDSADINWVQPFPSETVNGSGYICKLMMVPAAAAFEEFRR